MYNICSRNNHANVGLKYNLKQYNDEYNEIKCLKKSCDCSTVHYLRQRYS